MSERIRVLHLDDDADIVEMSAEFLERESDRLAVSGTTDVEDALARLRDEQVDCVVSDYQMPEANGLEVLDAVREEDPDVPFVLFTGEGSEGIASEAIRAGVTDYIQKGSTERYTVLAKRIEEAVDKHRAERAASRNEDRLRNVIDHLPHPVFVMDEDMTYLLSNEPHAAVHGRDTDDIEGSSASDVLGESFGSFEEDFREVVASGEPAYFPQVSIRDRSGKKRIFDSRLIPFDPPDDDAPAVLGVAIDVTEREERERQLEALHEATRELVQAEGVRAVADTIATTVTDGLGYPIAVVRLFDDDAAELRVAAVRTSTGEDVDRPPDLEVGEGPAGRAFEDGDVEVSDAASDPDAEERADMYVPIGDCGVVSICDATRTSFDEFDVRVASILAANAEAALERVERGQ